jgi:uncharacterized protein with HEPN domain
MPKRDWHLRIFDMQAAAKKIETYVAGMSFVEFTQDDRTVDAVLRNVEIIGEAAAHIGKSVRDRHKDIRWADIRGMRNIVAHSYFRVDAKILWNVTQVDLQVLRRQLAELCKLENL